MAGVISLTELEYGGPDTVSGKVADGPGGSVVVVGVDADASVVVVLLLDDASDDVLDVDVLDDDSALSADDVVDDDDVDVVSARVELDESVSDGTLVEGSVVEDFVVA